MKYSQIPYRLITLFFFFFVVILENIYITYMMNKRNIQYNKTHSQWIDIHKITKKKNILLFAVLHNFSIIVSRHTYTYDI